MSPAEYVSFIQSIFPNINASKLQKTIILLSFTSNDSRFSLFPFVIFGILTERIILDGGRGGGEGGGGGWGGLGELRRELP